MIVKCERCQTRFKIPDEKVTEKGVKVRCTKCQNTFRVTREATATPPPVAVADPFALFGQAEEPKKEVEITRPGFFKEGVEATKAPPPQPPSMPWNSADVDLDEDVHDEPTRVGPIPLPPEARPPPMTPFEPPPATPAARPGVAAPRSATTAFGSAPAPAPEADPFFDIDVDAGPPSPPPAEALRRTAASVPPPATPPAGAVALGLARPSGSPAPTPPPATDLFDAFDKDGPAPAPKPATAAGDVDLFGSFDFGDSEPAPAAPAKAPAAPAPSSLLDDAEPDRSLFGAGDAGLPAEAPEFKVSDSDSAVGRKEVIDLPPLPDLEAPASSREVIPELPGPISRPTGRPEDMGIPERKAPGAARRVTGLVINLAVATVLVVGLAAVGSVYLREGRLDLSVLSPARLQALVAPARPLVAVDVSNGLYDTREGHPLFFVRGDVENRGTSAARVKVRAALYDGDQRVKSQEGLAGALPTPEDLHAIVSTEGAAALRARLDASATPVPPGGRAPFVLVFQEYPAALDSFRLEVTLEAVASAPEAGATEGAKQ